MSGPGWSRRGFLRRASAACAVGSLGVSGLATPFLEAAKAKAQDFPKRFVVWFTPNGTIADAWGATGTETNFTLRTILEPLTPWKNKLLVLEGIDMSSAIPESGDNHVQGITHFLTSSARRSISIDQRIANHLYRTGRHRSIEFGVKNGSSNSVSRMCYAQDGTPLPPISSPYEAFERLFGELEPGAAGDSGLIRRRAMRQSVLDFVRDDFAAVARRIGREDRERLTSHMENLRELEDRLNAAIEAPMATCSAPNHRAGLRINDDSSYPDVGRLQIDNLVMALACDLTRVASLQWSVAGGNVTSPWLGINIGHHSISHQDTTSNGRDRLVRINRWYSEQLAYLLERLDSVREGSGTLLDNTIVLVGNELGRGGRHTHVEIPFLLAGGGGGVLRTGRHLRFGDRSHGDLYLTLCHAFGIDTDSFGDPRFITGPISALM